MTMKIRNKYHSFAFLCVVNIMTYSLLIFIFYSFIGHLTSSRLNNAFPVMYDLLAYDDELTDERYEDIPIHHLNNSSFIVFDAGFGDMLYASDERIRQNIHYDDLDFIVNHDSYFFYDVSIVEDDENHKLYSVTLKQYDPEANISYIYDQCLLNQQYQIVSGTLFAERGSLNERELSLMQGSFNHKMNIEKATFENKDGELRIAVFVSPKMDDAAYTRIIEENNRIWLYMTPIFLLLVLFQIYVFVRVTKRFFVPFRKAIAHYRQDGEIRINEEKIPLELQQTYHEFIDMVNELEQSKKEKKQIDEDRQRIIASISHDLKTPLTVIKGFSDVLLNHQVAQEDEKRYLQTIHSRAVVANDLIDALFAYNRINHPEYQLDLESVDICEEVKQFLADKYHEIEMRQFELDIMIPEDRIVCRLDRKMFSRLLENMIGNALKYNGQGTVISVALEKKDNQIYLTIGDNGVGIEDELLSQIFEPFAIGDQARSSGMGTGLGLSIVKTIVEQHHGTISAYTHTHGHAIEFVIVLPADESDEE